jgi:D-amino-acid dehydrogenase
MGSLRHHEIAVIGAGIVGVSTALWLQRDGHDVALIDPGDPGQATSYGNAGVIAAISVVPVTVPGLVLKAPKMLFDSMGPLYLRWRHLPKLLPWLLPYLRHCDAARSRATCAGLAALISDSVEQHHALAEGTEAARYLFDTDYLFAYGAREGYDAERFIWQLRQDEGYSWEFLEGAALRDFEPSLGPAVGFAVRCPNHAMVRDPGRYVAALAQDFVGQGGRLLRAEVEEIELEAGRVSGLKTSAGDMACEKVVVAAGPWSARLTRHLGLKTPLEAERGYHIEFPDPEVMPHCPVMFSASKFVASPMEGRLRCAGVVEFAGLDAPENAQPPLMLEKHAREAFPGLKAARNGTWMGRRPASIDSLPFLGEAASIKGLYCGFGHHHIGLTGGPKTGRLLSDLISGRQPNIDLAPYRVDRFH